MSKRFATPPHPLAPPRPKGSHEAGEAQIAALLSGEEPTVSDECLEWKGVIGRGGAPSMADPEDLERMRWVPHVLLPALGRPKPSEEYVIRREDTCPSEGPCIRPSHLLWESKDAPRQNLEVTRTKILRFVSGEARSPHLTKVIAASGEPNRAAAKEIAYDLCREGLMNLDLVGGTYRFSLTDAGRKRLAESV